MNAEDKALCREVSDLLWDLKNEAELLETRKAMGAPLRAVLQSTLRDAQRMKERLETAAHPRRKGKANG